MVARLLWECRGGIRVRSWQNAAKPCGTGNSEFFPVAENGTKAALTTGMTTDRKIFDFPPCRDIMAGTEYPGVAQLVGRDIWDVEVGCSSHLTRTKMNDPTQFEQVDETCGSGRVVLYLKSLGMTAFFEDITLKRI